MGRTSGTPIGTRTFARLVKSEGDRAAMNMQYHPQGYPPLPGSWLAI